MPAKRDRRIGFANRRKASALVWKRYCRSLFMACMPCFWGAPCAARPDVVAVSNGDVSALGSSSRTGRSIFGQALYGVRTVGGIEGFYAAGGLGADGIHWREAARAFEQVLSPCIVFKAFRGEHFHHRGYYVEMLGSVRLSAAETRLFNRPARRILSAPPRLPHRSYSPLRAGRGRRGRP